MLSRIWTGRRSFAIAFWLLGVILSPIFFWITFKLGKFLHSTWTMPVLLGVWFLYAVVVSILIWKSSSKYSGRKVWVYLARICSCIAWLITLAIIVGVFYFLRPDIFTNSYTIETQLEPDPSLPYIGFWKLDCSDNYGVAVQKAGTDEYSARFCSPAGCFGKTSFMRTRLTDNPKVKIIDDNTVGIDLSSYERKLSPEQGKLLQEHLRDGFLIFKRCK